MRVRYHGESGITTVIDGKEYEVIGIEGGLYRIIDEDGYDEDEETQGYLYSPECFEIVSGSPDEFVDPFADEDENHG